MGLSAKFGNAANVDKNYYKAMESSVYKTMSGSLAVINGFYYFLFASVLNPASALYPNRGVFFEEDHYMFSVI